MGYDVHITRREFWADEAGPSITPEEWLALIANDPELTIFERNGREVNGPYFAVWSGPGEYECWMDYRDGDLYSKNPTPEFMDKMVEIAKVLSAKVQGDDGETYPENEG